MKIVPIMALQDSSKKGMPYVDLDAAKKQLDLKFYVATYTLKDDNTYSVEFKNFELEPCVYSTYLKDNRWKEAFERFEKPEGKPSFFMCPSAEAIEVDMTSSNTVPRKVGDQYIEAGFNIYKCSGDHCGPAAGTTKAIEDYVVRMFLFEPVNQMQKHTDGPPFTYISKLIEGH